MTVHGCGVGDLVDVDKKGRRFVAVVEGRDELGWQVRPLDKRISYRSATSREVVGLYRKAAGSRSLS